MDKILLRLSVISKILILFGFIGWVQAQTTVATPQMSTAFKAGEDYTELAEPVVTGEKSKIEVVELFWYRCAGCYSFESIFQAWKKQQQADVDIVQMPAIWNKVMELHAKAFYTAKALGKMDEVHQPLFDALILKRKPIVSKSSIADFFADVGVDKNTFDATFDSFGVQSQVAIAKARMLSYRVEGTPEVIINGKYRVSLKKAKTQARMLEIADFLIAKERAKLKNNAVSTANAK